MSVSYKFLISYWGDLDQDEFVEHGSILNWKEAVEKITDVAWEDYKQISKVSICRSGPGRRPKWHQENHVTCYAPGTFPLRWSGTGPEWKAICAAEEEKAEEEAKWCSPECEDSEGCHKCNIFAYLEMEEQLPQMCALANAVVAAKLDGGKSQG